MSLLMITSIILLLFQFTIAQPSQNKKSGNLIIVINDLQNDDGAVLLALCDSKEDFERIGDHYLSLKIEIKEGIAKYTVSELPHGEYAIKLFHDENSDGKLNSNFLGLPSEDYAFSNNATGTFGPPNFADAKFIFDKPEMKISISVD